MVIYLYSRVLIEPLLIVLYKLFIFLIFFLILIYSALISPISFIFILIARFSLDFVIHLNVFSFPSWFD